MHEPLFFLKQNHRTSPYLRYPRRLWVSPPWIIWWWEGGSVSYLYRLSLFHFPIVKLYLAEDREGSRWGKRGRRRRRNVKEKAGAVSDSCFLAVWPQNNYLNPELCPTFKMGIMTVIAVLQGCGDDVLREYMLEKRFCKCHYTVTGTERWLRTRITCMIKKKKV